MTDTRKRLQAITDRVQADTQQADWTAPALCSACGRHLAPGIVHASPDRDHDTLCAWVTANSGAAEAVACPWCGAVIDDAWHAHQLGWKATDLDGAPTTTWCPGCQAVLHVPRTVPTGTVTHCVPCGQPLLVTRPHGYPVLQVAPPDGGAP